MKIQMYTPGSRIRIARGRLPIDPRMIGRTGTVVTHEGSTGMLYGVQLDGEAELRLFPEDELELADAAPASSGSSPLSGSEPTGP